jgi:hypothetical protein
VTGTANSCRLCFGYRWIRIVGAAARAYGHKELKAVCPACNADGRHSAEPTSWALVPVIHGMPVSVEGRR